jgi:hypothetical protein
MSGFFVDGFLPRRLKTRTMEGGDNTQIVVYYYNKLNHVP